MEKTVVELFAGVGGFRCGLNNVSLKNNKVSEKGSWKFLWANQWEPATKSQEAYECYTKRFGTDNVSISANISKDGASTTVEFTGTNSGGMTTTAGEQSGTIDGVTIEISNGLVNGDQIRVYKNATFTVSAPENKVVSKIEFTCTASGTSNYGPGGFAGSAGYSYSGYVGTWVGSSSSVTLTASGSQVRATSIKVTYEQKIPGHNHNGRCFIRPGIIPLVSRGLVQPLIIETEK